MITFHERWGPLWRQLPWMSGPSKWLHRWFEAFICKLPFDRFVAVSDYTRRALSQGGVAPHRIRRIYNGIDYRGFPDHRGSAEGAPYTFLFYGRLGVAKGVDLLLQAYSRLLEERQDHRLLMVVPSEQTPIFSEVRTMTEQLDISKYIEWQHDLDHKKLLSLIANIDAVVIPSYSEGFCFAAIESMAIGTPIISSGQGALSEVISGRYIELNEFSVEGLAHVRQSKETGFQNLRDSFNYLIL